MTIQIQLTDMSPKDKLAAIFMIEQHNKPIIAENARKAALTPPQAAAPTLPFATNAEIKTSYETVFIAIAQSAHNSYIAQEAAANGPDKQEWRDAFAIATAAQRNAGLVALKS